MTFALLEYNSRVIAFITHTFTCLESINDKIDGLNLISENDASEEETSVS